MIKQYYHRGVTLPQLGEIRELVDKRGQVQHLGRVKRVDPAARQADIEIMELDRNGRERKR